MGLTPVLLVAAAAVLAWPWIKEHWPKHFTVRHYVFAALLACAAWAYATKQPQGPTPAPVEGLSLRGQFVGADAVKDADAVSALCSELADEIEWDGNQPEPFLRTGVAFDELRVRSRMLMCRGESLGDKHPRARDTIKQYLETHLGISGGPVSPEHRAKWCAAYRDIARAAHEAVR